MKNWPALRAAGALSKVFDRPRDVAYWTQKLDVVYGGGAPSAWDYQWLYARLFGNKLVIVPSVNVIENIGYGSGATHTRIPDPRLMPRAKTIEFPLKHPNAIIASHSLELHHQDLYFQTLFHRIVRVINHLVNRARNMHWS